MSIELKEDTLNALKTGIVFLGKIKGTMCNNNDLTNKLDQVYYLFEELVKKWESEAKTERDCKPQHKNLVKLCNSAPMKPTKMESEKIMTSDVSPTFRERINNNESLTEGSKLNKKEKRSVFQQFRGRSRSEENIIDSRPSEKKMVKKRSSILNLVRMPMISPKDAEVVQYLSMQEIDPEMIMHSNKNNFCKVTKIKLKVNDTAIGARYLCLLGKDVLLGRELNDKVAEYVLNLGEYRSENRKNQYFELIKKDMTLSFRFDKESESAEWYHCLNKIIDSEVYSYIPASRGGPNPVNHKEEGERNKQLPYPMRQVHVNEYDYPEFRNKGKTSGSNVELHSPVQYEYTEVPHKLPKGRKSLPAEIGLNRSSCVKENVKELASLCESPNSSPEREKHAPKRNQFVAGDTSSLNRAKIALKPISNKLMKERSISM